MALTALRCGLLPRLYSIVMVILLLFGLLSLTHAATQESAKEYQIKAVYLYNFTGFVTWPNNVFEDAKASFRICILGEDPFGRQLDLAVRGEKVEGRNVLVERIDSVQQSSGCQILFISESETSQLNPIFNALEKKPILTVSDMPEFVERGGMIKFYTNRRRQVRLAIDPETLQEAGLTVSGNLLRVSQIIKSRSR